MVAKIIGLVKEILRPNVTYYWAGRGRNPLEGMGIRNLKK